MSGRPRPTVLGPMSGGERQRRSNPDDARNVFSQGSNDGGTDPFNEAAIASGVESSEARAQRRRRLYEIAEAAQRSRNQSSSSDLADRDTTFLTSSSQSHDYPPPYDTAVGQRIDPRKRPSFRPEDKINDLLRSMDDDERLKSRRKLAVQNETNRQSDLSLLPTRFSGIDVPTTNVDSQNRPVSRLTTSVLQAPKSNWTPSLGIGNFGSSSSSRAQDQKALADALQPQPRPPMQFPSTAESRFAIRGTSILQDTSPTPASAAPIQASAHSIRSDSATVSQPSTPSSAHLAAPSAAPSAPTGPSQPPSPAPEDLVDTLSSTDDNGGAFDDDSSDAETLSHVSAYSFGSYEDENEIGRSAIGTPARDADVISLASDSSDAGDGDGDWEEARRVH